jgi:lipid-A-disaccharide synthase
MHLFISAGEPSGDLHGANLVRALRARDPSVRVTGFGGDKMAAEGADLLYPVAKLSVMWFVQALLHLLTFIRLARRASHFFKTEKPGAVVLIDCPGFNFVLAKRAHAAGIPVYYFVPPQLWAWAGWRVKKMRKWVTRVFTALPFEEVWYRERGVATQFVGHPYYDALAAQTLDPGFLSDEKAKPGPVVAILPGSRKAEVTTNFKYMLAAADRVRAAKPGVRFLVASFNGPQRAIAEGLSAGSGLPLEFHVGRTPEIIELADAVMSVSGSVSLELMYRQKPAVILYKVGYVFGCLALAFFLKVRYITLVNLLADDEVFPEYPTMFDRSRELAEHVIRWLTDPAARTERVDKVRKVRDAIARPGACDRVADFLVGACNPAAPADRTAA